MDNPPPAQGVIKNTSFLFGIAVILGSYQYLSPEATPVINMLGSKVLTSIAARVRQGVVNWSLPAAALSSKGTASQSRVGCYAGHNRCVPLRGVHLLFF